jgi:hypothetical protein
MHRITAEDEGYPHGEILVEVVRVKDLFDLVARRDGIHLVSFNEADDMVNDPVAVNNLFKVIGGIKNTHFVAVLLRHIHLDGSFDNVGLLLQRLQAPDDDAFHVFSSCRIVM